MSARFFPPQTAGRRQRRPGLCCLVFLSFLAAAVFSSSSSLAFENPERYYDWGPSQTRVNPQVLGASVYAQETSTPSAVETIKNYGKFNYFLGFAAGLTQDNPFYFVKTLQENVALALTLNPQRREEVRLEIAGRRLEELEKLAGQNKAEALAKAARAYRQNLDQVSDRLDEIKPNLSDPTPTMEKFEEEAARHSLILSEVSVRIPSASQVVLEEAVLGAQKMSDTTADLSGKPPVPVEVLDRLQSLKQQGLLSSEEVNILTAVRSRTEARGLLRKYAKEGVFPEADLHKFDEVARLKFEGDYRRVVELKKFFELKKLEEEKPDEETVKKVQEFAKSYKAGEIVPPDLRRYWVPLVRLEELQNTLRPDLIDEKILQDRPGDFEKFQEVVRRVQPRPEDILLVERLISQNPNAALDPFYERVRRISEKFGASCAPGLRWVPFPQTGGYCLPENTPVTEAGPTIEIREDRACGQAITPAKGPGGVCAVFPNTCLPPGWAKVNSCSADAADVAKVSPSLKTCPTNSHWASVAYMPEGGFCVPNITYTLYVPQTTAEGQVVVADREEVCPVKYHRNYPNGPCVPDTYFGPATGYPTYTPGPFPSPLYMPAARCPSGYFWSGTTCLSESRACGYGQIWDPATRSCTSSTLPYFPKCGPNEYSGPNGVCTANDKSAEAGKCAGAGKFWTGRECLDKAPEGGAGVACPEGQVWDDKNKGCSSGGYGGIPRGDMGGCRTPGECFDYCKANPGKCPGFDPNSSRPSDGMTGMPSRESQEAACKAGGGTCVSWVNNACGCERPGGNTGSGNTGNWSCPQGQYLGPGGYCISSYSGNAGYTPSRESQEAACRAGGGTCVSWVNNACGCERPVPSSSGPGGWASTCPSGQYMGPGGYCISSGGTGGGYTPPSGGYTPPSGYGSCPSGQYWNGSSCQSSSYTPPSTSESPEQACLRGTNCSWTGSSCNCSPSSPTPAPTPTPAPESSPPPPPPPAPSPSPEPSPGSSCLSGSYWNGSSCVTGQY